MSGTAAAIGAFIDVGSRNEDKEVNGIAHFLEHLAFKGTNKRTAYDISCQIENLGAYTNAMTSSSYTGYYVKGLVDHLPIAADILGDVLTNSKYDQEDIDTEKGVILQEIKQYEDSPISVMYRDLSLTAFPDQPVGRDTLGTVEFVSNAKTDDFKKFIGKNYSSETMIVVATGGVDHDEIVKIVEDAFSAVPKSTSKPAVVPASYSGGFSINRDKPFSQVSIGVLFPSVPVCDYSRYSFDLLSDAFGSGMSSPLFREIRKRGLVYHTSSSTEFEKDFGVFNFIGMLGPENLEEYIKVSCSEFIKTSESVEEIDLVRAKNMHLVSLAYMEESAVSMMFYIMNSMFFYGRVRTFDEIRHDINKVTTNDLVAASKRLLASKPTIAMVGPVPEFDYEDLIMTSLKMK